MGDTYQEALKQSLEDLRKLAKEEEEARKKTNAANQEVKLLIGQNGGSLSFALEDLKAQLSTLANQPHGESMAKEQLHTIRQYWQMLRKEDLDVLVTMLESGEARALNLGGLLLDLARSLGYNL